MKAQTVPDTRGLVPAIYVLLNTEKKRRGCPGQAHNCPARFVLSCRLLHRGASTTCTTTLDGPGCTRPEVKDGLWFWLWRW